MDWRDKPQMPRFLNNFEIVTTTLIALLWFGEFISCRLWAAIGLITAASILLTVQDSAACSSPPVCFGPGSSCLLGAGKQPYAQTLFQGSLQVVVIKGRVWAWGRWIIALLLHQTHWYLPGVLGALGLGFVAYGLSIFFYISAQRQLGGRQDQRLRGSAVFWRRALFPDFPYRPHPFS